MVAEEDGAPSAALPVEVLEKLLPLRGATEAWESSTPLILMIMTVNCFCYLKEEGCT